MLLNWDSGSYNLLQLLPEYGMLIVKLGIFVNSTIVKSGYHCKNKRQKQCSYCSVSVRMPMRSCVGRRDGSVLADVSIVCRPTSGHLYMVCRPTLQWRVDRHATNALFGSDSLPYL